MRQSHVTFKQFNLTVKKKKFRSNRLEFQPSFIVKLLFITVLQSRGACFREQSKFFKSGNLFVIYLDKLSIYNWTEPWNIKGRFPEWWGLRASLSSSPFPFFCSRSNSSALTRLETLATQAITNLTGGQALACGSRVTSHDIPQMKWRACTQAITNLQDSATQVNKS